jgi:uncharacterized membrane protein YbhN (UPF0104 family)
VRVTKKSYVIISAILSILLLSLLFTKVDFGELAGLLKNIYFPALLAYMGLALGGAVLRAWRYTLFLAPQSIRRRDILMTTFIRNSFVDLLPARLGSLSFIYVLTKRLNFSFEKATSAFVASFVYDFLTLGPFLGLALIAVGGSVAPLSGTALYAAAGIFFAVCLIVLIRLPFFFGIGVRIFEAVLKLAGRRNSQRGLSALSKLEATRACLEVIQEKKLGIPFFILSLGVRAAKYVSIYFLLFGLLRSLHFGFGDISFWKLILGITGAEMTSVLPVKGLAGFGTWESAWAIAFGLMKYEPRISILSGLGVHLVTNVFEYALGIGSLAVLAAPLLRRRKGI